MFELWNAYVRIPLLKKMFSGMVLGIVIGLVWGQGALALEPLGTFFLSLLQMIALPLIIVNLLAGLCSLDDPKLFGRVGVKVLIYYCVTTVFAMVIALAVGSFIQPGAGFELSGNYKLNTEGAPSIWGAILSMFPTNVFAALASGKFDQVVVFVAVFGIAALFLPAAERMRIQSFSDICSRIFGKIMGAVMLYAPVGICALMAKTFGKYGASMGSSVAKYVASAYISVLCLVGVYLILR